MNSSRKRSFMLRGPADCSLFLALMWALSGLGIQGYTQTGAEAKQGTNQPSNAQLASPEIERRVDELLKKMTLDEKLGQLVQYSDSGYNNAKTADEAANPGKNPTAQAKVDAMDLVATGKLGSLLNTVGQARTNELQHAAVDKSRLHIPLMFGADIIHGYKTIYPIPLGLAATFDPELVTSLARISATEARTGGVDWFYSPMVDISRDPRWGRTQEGAGEDAYLGAAMARAYVRGYQQSDLSLPTSVAACVKHFAAYRAAEAGREYNTTDMSLSRLHQVYLPPYKAAVEAGAATIMSAFNALNGVPASANPYLLHQVLRNDWGFDGFVVSDYTAIMELRNHGIALDAATAARKAITAGVDVDMMSHYYDAELPGLIKSGQVPMSVVDEAVRRVLRVKFAMGLFEHPYAEGKEVTSAVPEHRPLVRKAAEESIVLLKNSSLSGGASVLPLQKNLKTIALIGPLADDTGAMTGTWGETRRDADVVTVRDALEQRMKQAGGSLLYTKGTDIGGTSEAGFAEAVDDAKRADVAVLALGESAEMSGEAGSRAYLDLPGNQEQLLEAVAATGRPVILLVFSGRPLVLDWAAAHVPAIMEAWFPGTEAGNAVADLIFGDVVPSGKLPMSFPRAVGQEPLYYNQFPTGRPPVNIDLNHPGEGDSRFVSRYIDVPNDALFPFGFGLSYTTYTYANVEVSRHSVPMKEASSTDARDLITVTATVTNHGKRAGIEVVECYVRNLGASLEQPVRSLQGFERVSLEPGESKQITFKLGFPELSFWDNAGHQVIEPTDYTVWVGGSSTAEEHAEFRIVP
jgi:beta-glucosidase